MAKILFLGPQDSPVLAFLKSVETEVVQTMDRIDENSLDLNTFDFLVSYGYRRIIKKNEINKFPNAAINMHISLLPWNRGADPNLWSFVENTPKGVSIHYLDEGVDTGDIIVQKEVNFSLHETLKTSYLKLHDEIQHLFFANWKLIRGGRCGRRRQEGEGSFHRMKDKERVAHLLVEGWDTPVSVLEDYAARA